MNSELHGGQQHKASSNYANQLMMKPVNDHPIGRQFARVSEGRMGRLREPTDDQPESGADWLNSE